MRKKSFFSNVVKRFTHWSHKGYGVFESLKTVVNIGVLPLSYCLLAMPMATFAQPDSVAITKNVDIEEVVVNARKKANTYSELSRVVRVVSRDELGQHGAIALGDLLEQVAAIDVRQRGSHGVQADINFRGGTFDQVMILLNGVNFTDPQTGHHNLNIPINIDAVERIEILQGPGAWEYGAGAFTGAMNIITKPDLKERGRVSVFAGEHGLVKVSASQNLGNRKVRTFAAASYDKSDGYIDNTDFKNLNLFLHTSSVFAGGELYGFAGYQDKAFGANSFYTPKYPNQFEATKTMLGSMGYERSWDKFILNVNGYYRKHTDRFELFRSNPPAWYTGHNYHATDVYGGKVSGLSYNFMGKTDVGLELRREEILSNKLGTPLADSVKVWGEDVYYKKGDSRNHLIAYATQTMKFGKINLSIGGQFNHSNKYGDIWTWGVDLSYPIYLRLRPFASFNRSYRLPTFTDLYYQGPTNMGNPNLKAEYANTYEIGIEYSYFTRLEFELAGFYRMGSNIIDWVKPANETIWRTVNYTKLNTWGGNANFILKLKGLGVLTDRVSLSYAFATSEKENSEMDSYYVLDYLVHNLSLNAYHSIFRVFYFNWTVRYQDRNGEYLRYVDANTSVPTKYPSVWIVDARFGYSTPKLNIYVDSRNLLNQVFVDIANVQQPGRWLGIGLNYSFDL